MLLRDGQKPKQLLIRVPPKRQESLSGYLMRTAQANHLGNPSQLLHLLGGKAIFRPTSHDILLLAELCRCHADEIDQLFGIEIRHADGTRGWRLGSEWITKEYFVSYRFPVYCPECLATEPYLRGCWDLTLYRACPHHGHLLTNLCPACQKSVRWDRRHMLYCNCGADLRNHSTSSASLPLRFVAELIQFRIDPDFKMLVARQFPLPVVQRLASLSLDGLCKTLWFLGHLVAELGKFSVGHGRQKLDTTATENVIDHAIDILEGWPNDLLRHLTRMSARPVSGSTASYLDQLFGPLQAYLTEDMSAPEFNFVRLTYEQCVRRIWKTLRRERPLRTLDRQATFDFGDKFEPSDTRTNDHLMAFP